MNGLANVPRKATTSSGRPRRSNYHGDFDLEPADPTGAPAPVTGGVFKNAAFEILKQEERLMTSGEITKLAMERKLLKCMGKTPENTMASALYTEVRKKASTTVFIKPKEGLFGLKAWLSEAWLLNWLAQEGIEAADLLDPNGGLAGEPYPKKLRTSYNGASSRGASTLGYYAPASGGGGGGTVQRTSMNGIGALPASTQRTSLNGLGALPVGAGNMGHRASMNGPAVPSVPNVMAPKPQYSGRATASGLAAAAVGTTSASGGASDTVSSLHLLLDAADEIEGGPNDQPPVPRPLTTRRRSDGVARQPSFRRQGPPVSRETSLPPVIARARVQDDEDEVEGEEEDEDEGNDALGDEGVAQRDVFHLLERQHAPIQHCQQQRQQQQHRQLLPPQLRAGAAAQADQEVWSDEDDLQGNWGHDSGDGCDVQPSNGMRWGPADDDCSHHHPGVYRGTRGGRGGGGSAVERALPGGKVHGLPHRRPRDLGASEPHRLGGVPEYDVDMGAGGAGGEEEDSGGDEGAGPLRRWQAARTADQRCGRSGFPDGLPLGFAGTRRYSSGSKQQLDGALPAALPSPLGCMGEPSLQLFHCTTSGAGLPLRRGASIASGIGGGDPQPTTEQVVEQLRAVLASNGALGGAPGFGFGQATNQLAGQLASQLPMPGLLGLAGMGAGFGGLDFGALLGGLPLASLAGGGVSSRGGAMAASLAQMVSSLGLSPGLAAQLLAAQARINGGARACASSELAAATEAGDEGALPVFASAVEMAMKAERDAHRGMRGLRPARAAADSSGSREGGAAAAVHGGDHEEDDLVMREVDFRASATNRYNDENARPPVAGANGCKAKRAAVATGGSGSCQSLSALPKLSCDPYTTSREVAGVGIAAAAAVGSASSGADGASHQAASAARKPEGYRAVAVGAVSEQPQSSLLQVLARAGPTRASLPGGQPASVAVAVNDAMNSPDSQVVGADRASPDTDEPRNHKQPPQQQPQQVGHQPSQPGAGAPEATACSSGGVGTLSSGAAQSLLADGRVQQAAVGVPSPGPYEPDIKAQQPGPLAQLAQLQQQHLDLLPAVEAARPGDVPDPDAINRIRQQVLEMESRMGALHPETGRAYVLLARVLEHKGTCWSLSMAERALLRAWTIVGVVSSRRSSESGAGAAAVAGVAAAVAAEAGAAGASEMLCHLPDSFHTFHYLLEQIRMKQSYLQLQQQQQLLALFHVVAALGAGAVGGNDKGNGRVSLALGGLAGTELAAMDVDEVAGGGGGACTSAPMACLASTGLQQVLQHMSPAAVLQVHHALLQHQQQQQLAQSEAAAAVMGAACGGFGAAPAPEALL